MSTESANPDAGLHPVTMDCDVCRRGRMTFSRESTLDQSGDTFLPAIVISCDKCPAERWLATGEPWRRRE